SNFAADIRYPELAIIDPSPADHNNVAVIPAAMLTSGAQISDPALPFPVTIDRLYHNSEILGPAQAQQANLSSELQPTAGSMSGVTMIQIPQERGTDADKYDIPGAFVTIKDSSAKPQTVLLTCQPEFDNPQDITFNGKHYQIALRFKRYYKPFTMHLSKFTHELYTGSEKPKDYASQIQLTDPTNNVDREVKIWMNHPFRYAGETFYQSGFDQLHDRFTILQVVHNPAWFFPYLACSMVALGMLIHFGAILIAFLQRQNATTSSKATKSKTSSGTSVPLSSRPSLYPAILTSFAILYLFSLATPPRSSNNTFDLSSFGRLPISYEGRVMPLDSLARNNLRIISGKEELQVDNQTQPATWWLINVMAKPEQAVDYPVILIDHPEIVSQLGLDPNRRRFSVKEITAKPDVLEQQVKLAQSVGANSRDLYQRKVMELDQHLGLFFRFAQVESLYLAPPLVQGMGWQPVADALKGAADQSNLNEGVRSLLSILDAYHENKPADFNSAVAGYESFLQMRLPDAMSHVEFETLFNRIEPFMAAIYLYVFVFLLICFSWLGWTQTLTRSAFWILLVTLSFHTLGLIARIYIGGRPPVTNLYSSAIFIGWGVAVMCVCLELIYKNGIGTLLASVIGFCTLVIAQHLANVSENGDTFELMQAVLDTNFWLATHVVVVTLGYAATFLAGFLAITYIAVGTTTNLLRNDGGKTLYRMVYGILCFAMLFSFVGTILGGIWADQSWGRFWGWDPKENGAVLIVLWNATILHARWGGLVKARGVMNMAVFGNIVTSWSWFGTNMLGVGLHSYGFMEKSVPVLVGFVLAMLLIISIGSLPLTIWRSFATSKSSRSEETIPLPNNYVTSK
ncbi:MAG TPA: cytochrome c biogenesis protein CcsA, partial [Tepidisphaeraceae bacterium]|nr:cytochrome c biogenesis protein CcsA [Tepidisphaeraceae bacterium]